MVDPEFTLPALSLMDQQKIVVLNRGTRVGFSKKGDVFMQGSWYAVP